MLRFLLRRIPRFGFLTLFAAMLLFVSVAGWAKWNLDLWREEEALLAEIAEARLGVTYRRGLADPVETRYFTGSPTSSPARYAPIVEPFSRIEAMKFSPGYAEPGELLERAASLPFVRSVSGDIEPDGTITTEATAAIAGFDLTPLPTPERPVDLSPLPHGEAVEESEAIWLKTKIAEALKAERPPPPTQGTAYLVTTRRFFCGLYAWNDSKSFVAYDGHVEIATAQSFERFVSDSPGFLQIERTDDPEAAQERFVKRRSGCPENDGTNWLNLNLKGLGFEPQFRTALEDVEAIRVERIDERTYRFDLPAFVLKFPPLACEDAYTISLVARSDLDWNLEAWDVVGARSQGPSTWSNIPAPANFGYRGVLRREGSWIVADEWTRDAVSYSMSGLKGAPPSYHPHRESGIARYDFTSDIDLSHVTPELFDAKLLPPRRELPWLRWHRVTFVLSLGLFAFVGGKKLVARKRRPEDSEP